MEEPVYFSLPLEAFSTLKYVPVTETDIGIHYDYIPLGHLRHEWRSTFLKLPPEAYLGRYSRWVSSLRPIFRGADVVVSAPLLYISMVRSLGRF